MALALAVVPLWHALLSGEAQVPATMYHVAMAFLRGKIATPKNALFGVLRRFRRRAQSRLALSTLQRDVLQRTTALWG